MASFSSSLAGSIVVGSGIVGLVAGALLNYRYSKKLEAFKWLYAEQAKALVEMYRHLKRFEAALNLLFAPVQMDASTEAETKRIQGAWAAAIKTFRFFGENEVFFSEAIAGQFESLRDEYEELLNPILVRRRLPDGLDLAEVWDRLGSLKPLLKELKNTIQTKLNVE